MSSIADTFFDSFTEPEAVSAAAMMRELTGIAWAQQLLAAITAGGGLTRTNMPLFFELRFGHALHTAGIVPSYEVPGEGRSTIDFGFNSASKSFRVELMRLTETAAAKAATHASVAARGVTWVSRVLTDLSDDPRQSEKGETLKAIERICQKCEQNGKPYKFPQPGANIHVLLVDFRTFLCGDAHDCTHIALGSEYVVQMFRQHWEGRPITGVFSPETALKGAAQARERIHFIGFVDEKAVRPRRFRARDAVRCQSARVREQG